MALPIMSAMFTTFLVTAKRQTYAAQEDSATVPPLLPGARQLEYREQNLLYRDIYFGGAYFVGQETIYDENAAIWAMSYAGGLTSPENNPALGPIYAFLQSALRLVTSEQPYRGPSRFQVGVYVYQNESDGSIERFSGLEFITCGGQRVYELRYAGGGIR